MRKYKEIALWAVFTAMVGLTLTPLIYWGFHPHMTYMELFQQFWPIYIPVVVLYIVNKKLLKL
jgi:hypothetical protein